MITFDNITKRAISKRIKAKNILQYTKLGELVWSLGALVFGNDSCFGTCEIV